VINLLSCTLEAHLLTLPISDGFDLECQCHFTSLHLPCPAKVMVSNDRDSEFPRVLMANCYNINQRDVIGLLLTVNGVMLWIVAESGSAG